MSPGVSCVRESRTLGEDSSKEEERIMTTKAANIRLAYLNPLHPARVR
jgi:hypothetical protein